MSAGMISVPAIIPLKPPGLGAAGSRKWSIDTNTLIEMQTNTKSCIIFYTLNGTKPDPFKKIGDKTTYHYSRPITLQAGKRTLKAIAVFKDGTRESNVNTKVFQVSAVTKVDVEDEFEKQSKFNTTWKSQISDDDDCERYEKMFKKVAISSIEKQGTTSNEKDPVRRVLTDDVKTDSYFENHKQFTSEENYFACTECDALRPSDPYARFCNYCSAILPPAPGKIRSPKPYSHININNSNNHSMCNDKINNRINCKNCGTANPNNVFECLVCDEPLGNPVSKLRKSSCKALQPSNDFIVCPYCTRINSGNARFCDWCGESSHSSSRLINCKNCTTENSVSSKYCCSCGKTLTAPPRKSFEDAKTQGNVKGKERTSSKMELLSKLTDESDYAEWKNIEFDSITRKEAKNVSIQVGDSMIPNGIKASKQNNKTSPGKGYWRQQLDFIAQHLKVFTQSNTNFRDQVSNYMLSRLTSASVSENVDDNQHEIELKILFALHENGDKKKHKKLNSINAGETLINTLSKKHPDSPGRSRSSSGRSRPVSASSKPSLRPQSERRGKSSDKGHFDSENSNTSRPNSGRKNKLSHKTLEKEKLEVFLSKLSSDTKKLLNIIKSSKEIDIEDVEELLDSEDIDVNATDENGIPFLKLSVINKHYDLIQLLITAGAEIDTVSGVKANTALHEAVTLGIMGKDATEVLLDNEASTDIKDKKGKIPHDIAVDNGHDSVLSLFNKHTSKGLLKDVLKL